MRLQVLKEGQGAVEGYKHVFVKDQAADFSEVSDNECVEILANDVLDDFTIDNIGQFLQVLRSKLRMGGTLCVGGTDLRLFCMNVIDGSIDPVMASQLVGIKSSMTSCETTRETLKGMGLAIEAYDPMGVHYEITSRRV